MKMQLLLCTAKIKCQLTHQCSFTLCFCFGGVLIYKNYCYCPEYVPQFFTRVESLLPTLSVDICFKQLISKSYVCLICMTYDVCLSQLLEESHDNFPQLDRFYKETAIKIQQRERERETPRAVGSYQQLPLHHFLSFLYSHYPTSSHHQMTPSQLEMYVRICVERIFFSFFSPTYCYDSIHPLEQG